MIWAFLAVQAASSQAALRWLLSAFVPNGLVPVEAVDLNVSSSAIAATGVMPLICFDPFWDLTDPLPSLVSLEIGNFIIGQNSWV